MDETTMQRKIEEIEKLQDKAGSSAVHRAITSASRKSMPSFNKESVPKLDTDVKAPKGAPTSRGVTPIEKKRRSNGAMPPPLSAIPNVFELSATGNERPSTANGAVAVNGLRINGILKEDLVASKPTNDRPKTIAGQTRHRSV
ncbi:hypothetical protein B0A55_06628 [Friedmanniomyces simplex]|uniref:Uncharacterized protein n=1 Tax=Friedmanniomyces simplex TaxID=329884 RepID=A0A4U0XPQ6_9PEZI|nr:hypothetical protein B0A55_06628 [Friedmanniomyces simplex]